MAISTASYETKSPSADDPVRIMIVDDSAVFRGLVSRWLEEEGMSIVARHTNGELAVQDVAKSEPEIIILDVEMPVMDGLTALPQLLKSNPRAKVIMASTLTRRNAQISLKALSLGATDYIPKPETNRGITTSKTFRQELVDKIYAISGKKRIKKSVNKDNISGQNKLESSISPTIRTFASKQTPKELSFRPLSKIPPRIIAIGSSTGGPQALLALMKEIASITLNIPVVITQHMPATFTTILAEHLTSATGRPAKEGENGEALQPGGVYVAPGGLHMLLEEKSGQSIIRLDSGPEVNFCKPAVDPMFESISKIYKAATLGIVLTGMGQDGAVGAGNIADAGGSIIAQDKETSVVWGMPGATANLGNASAVLPLADIGKKIKMLINGGVS